MHQFILIAGLPGCGKTTLAQQLDKDFILFDDLSIILINQNISKLDKDTQKLSTGWVSGMKLKINSIDNTKVDIEHGNYIYSDYSDILNPVVSVITYAGQNEITPAYLTTANIT